MVVVLESERLKLTKSVWVVVGRRMKLLIIEKLEQAARRSDTDGSLEGVKRLIESGRIATADSMETALRPVGRRVARSRIQGPRRRLAFRPAIGKQSKLGETR